MGDRNGLDCKPGYGPIAALSLLAALACPETARAQSVLVGASADFDPDLGCPILAVEFAEPLDLLVQSGAEASSQIDLVLREETEDGEGLELDAPESIPAPSSSDLGVTSIGLEQSGADLVLGISFARAVITNATMSSDGLRLSVAVADAGDEGECLASLTGEGPEPDGPEPDGTALSEPETDADPAETAGDEPALDEDDTETDFADARAAITAEDYDLAIRLLTRILNAPENSRSAEARELLGVVRERNEQFAQAEAEYLLYLERYPDSEGAVRVRQRLDALTTARGAPPEPLREVAEADSARPEPAEAEEEEAEEDVPVTPDLEQPEPPEVTDRRRADAPEAEEDEREEEEETFPKLEYSGSVDSTYFFRQGTTRFTEFDTSRRSVDDFVLQNSLVTSLSTIGSYETEDYLLSWRVAGAFEIDFDDEEENFRFSRLYLDYDPKGTDLSLRFGRHLVRSGGVFDRFDGATLSWQHQEDISSHFQIGSPVDSVRDSLFAFDRLFYGLSVDFAEIYPDTDLTIYAAEQRVGSLVDRRTVGFELEYEGEWFSADAAVDYDIYFDRLNYARVSGTHIFEDRSTITLSLDFVQSPTLALSNAEQGQLGMTLDDLRDSFTLSELRQLALDRTTASRSATLTYFRPLNETWLLNMDATIFDTEGNPASGGVAEIPAPGKDYYASIGVFGSGVFSETDVVSASARYADTSSSTLVLADASYRFEPTEQWRLRPRLRLGHRDLKNTGGTEIFAIPSLNVDYEIRDNTMLELEIGGRLSRAETSTTRDNSTESYAFIGIRQDF
ncbi:autotransporter domain-containing protein [Limimaricola sp. G21655-S1]|uniref:autotransporter domain-containing protein n=1 Tax=Limimaricola sp. G21655-S1 TaxID=3014768 RepID=UPI0022AF25DB|nr:autotransporter domain-containing protein [Limimaricola sp. G21655-S1]MCZ4261087.1 autotransporter domain-containing protein [Limimaricola sp. G21655-S1]